jgi:hypothetical protein
MPEAELTVRRAASEAVVATLITSVLAVGMFDLGVLFYILAAAASSTPSPVQHPASELELRHA